MKKDNTDVILKSDNIDNKLFKMEANLFKAIKWEQFNLIELKTIIHIYSCINPEWKKLNTIKISARELKNALSITRNMGFSEVFNVFKSIKEKVFNFSTTEAKNNNLFPVKNIMFSLIGSVESILEQDEENDYIPSVNKVEIAFDKHIHDNILFSRNVKKDEKGKIIEGVAQYFECNKDSMLAFNDVYALRLFLELFCYNNICVKRDFNVLCEKMGVKTPRANLKTEIKSMNSSGRKIDKTRKKYYDFKSRKLKSAVEEINRCTNMGLTFTENIKKKKDGTCEIDIIFNIPEYRLDSSVDLSQKDSEESNSSQKDDDSFDVKEENNNALDLIWFDEDFNFTNTFDDNLEDSNIEDFLTEEDENNIKGLHLIYKYRLDIAIEDIEKIYIENSKDAIKTNKILQEIVNKKNGL